MKETKKLVRDKIPEIIEKDGRKPIIRIMDRDEFLKELIEKLKEETEELEQDLSAEELADLQEIILAIADEFKVSHAKLEKIRQAKAAKRGAFKKRIYLEGIINEKF